MTTRVKLSDGSTLLIYQTTGPSSYDATNGYTVTLPCTKVLDVIAISVGGGYVAGAPSLSANQVTFHIYVSGGTEVTGGADLSGQAVRIVAIVAD